MCAFERSEKGMEFYMRNRTIKKQFWLNETEDNLLKEKSKKAGLSEAEFIRSFINGYKLKEKPDENFYDVLKDLREIVLSIFGCTEVIAILNHRTFFVFVHNIFICQFAHTFCSINNICYTADG